jgi:hypothetical protein
MMSRSCGRGGLHTIRQSNDSLTVETRTAGRQRVLNVGLAKTAAKVRAVVVTFATAYNQH